MAAHSHRHIHAGWAHALRRMGLKVLWLDDEPSQASRVPEGAIVLASNVAQKHLPWRSDLRYVLHNVSPDDPGMEDITHRAIWWQVWTRQASGSATETPCVSVDWARRTIFQPWGTPFPRETWRAPFPGGSRHEYWIGSIWDNEAGQGNRAAILAWRRALARRGITFRKAPRGWPDSPRAYSALVRRSALAAAITGEWQADQEYAPCRLFKNVSCGALPLSNDPVVLRLFGECGIHSADFDQLIDRALSLSPAESRARTMSAQEILGAYTYEAGLRRALRLLDELVP